MRKGDDLMDFKEFAKPCFTDLDTWLKDGDVHNVLFRWWLVDNNGEEKFEECNYGFLTHFIELPKGEVLVGIQSYDETKDNLRYPSIHYFPLSRLQLVAYENDQEEDEAQWDTKQMD